MIQFSFPAKNQKLWSDITNDERTLQNEVEEIRSALTESNINGPYVLMPHSISGLHAIYYANTYPDEIEGIIGIDCNSINLCLPILYIIEASPILANFLIICLFVPGSQSNAVKLCPFLIAYKFLCYFLCFLYIFTCISHTWHLLFCIKKAANLFFID